MIRFEYHQPTSLVVRYAAAHDVGYAANPTLAEGQIHGGVAQGISMALMEEIVYRNGHVINNNWTDKQE